MVERANWFTDNFAGSLPDKNRKKVVGKLAFSIQ
jgi:hypothetical protein